MCRTHSEEGKTTLVTFRFLSRQKTWECMSQGWTRAGRVELAICPPPPPPRSAPVPLGNLTISQGHTLQTSGPADPAFYSVGLRALSCSD